MGTALCQRALCHTPQNGWKLEAYEKQFSAHTRRCPDIFPTSPAYCIMASTRVVGAPTPEGAITCPVSRVGNQCALERQPAMPAVRLVPCDPHLTWSHSISNWRLRRLPYVQCHGTLQCCITGMPLTRFFGAHLCYPATGASGEAHANILLDSPASSLSPSLLSLSLSLSVAYTPHGDARQMLGMGLHRTARIRKASTHSARSPFLRLRKRCQART